jgi:hypothetical protein
MVISVGKSFKVANPAAHQFDRWLIVVNISFLLFGLVQIQTLNIKEKVWTKAKN